MNSSHFGTMSDYPYNSNSPFSRRSTVGPSRMTSGDPMMEQMREQFDRDRESFFNDRRHHPWGRDSPPSVHHSEFFNRVRLSVIINFQCSRSFELLWLKNQVDINDLQKIYLNELIFHLCTLKKYSLTLKTGFIHIINELFI